ncbi:DUF2254 family protein [Altericroceibacterium xinjiangense]|uniref:DUF2254 family protein n=1 Tax=Altericroceibacterium xinjiangense TaxID=762261 RepID=UPI0013DED18A|nr:DUF2254 family protein [Altericroceibacterium xinjiangense]
MAGSKRHHFWSNFWALPSAMIFGAVVLTGLLLALDARGGSAWMGDRGWPFAITGKTAQQLASALVTLHSTFSTLYFSITLLVLTLAAGNLGVRLIDRWISDREIRFTLGLLMSLLAASVVVLFSVDSDAAPDRVPRLTLTVLVVATILALGWMTKALNHLGRTVHVDTSIAELGRNAARSLSRNRQPGPLGIERETGVPILACETGYVDELDSDAILREACNRGAFVRFLRGTGDFMIEGEQIGIIIGDSSGDWVNQHLTCAAYRNDTNGPIFECNLLVEIAARALSPGINDFYTALTCCDRLAGVFATALNVRQAPQWLCDKQGTPRLELPTERVTQFMDGPLKALRQAAASYPPVIIHMIKLIGRLPCAGTTDEDVRAFLLAHANAMAQHGSSQAGTDLDRADIAGALETAQRSLAIR